MKEAREEARQAAAAADRPPWTTATVIRPLTEVGDGSRPTASSAAAAPSPTATTRTGRSRPRSTAHSRPVPARTTSRPRIAVMTPSPPPSTPLRLIMPSDFHGRNAPATIMTPDALRLACEPIADCARYDSLRRAV